MLHLRRLNVQARAYSIRTPCVTRITHVRAIVIDKITRVVGMVTKCAVIQIPCTNRQGHFVSKFEERIIGAGWTRFA